MQRVYDVLAQLNKLSNAELIVICKALAVLSDNRFDDGEWKTLENGVHIQIGENGRVEKGPDVLKGKSKGTSQNTNDTRLQPKNTDYNWEYGDSINDFIHKNVDKLKPIYEENSRTGVEDEYWKFRTAATTKNLREMSHEEAQDILDNSIDAGVWQGWFQEADQDFKPKLVDAMLQNSEVRSAALSNMYYMAKNIAETNGEEIKPFDEWLNTPMKLYRGGTGKEYDKPALFSAYSMDKSIAQKFADSENSTQIYEMEIKPIDTWGSARAKGEAEVEVPSFVAVNGNKDSREDGIDKCDKTRYIYNLDNEEDGWFTDEKGHRYHINEKGICDKGPNYLKGTKPKENHNQEEKVILEDCKQSVESITKGRKLKGNDTSPNCSGFVNVRKRTEHYSKHCKDRDEPILSSFKTEEEYEEYAKKFINQPVGGRIFGYSGIDNKGRKFTVRFDAETGMFAKGFIGGEIKTCTVAKYCTKKGKPYEDYKHRAADYFVSEMYKDDDNGRILYG